MIWSPPMTSMKYSLSISSEKSAITKQRQADTDVFIEQAPTWTWISKVVSKKVTRWLSHGRTALWRANQQHKSCGCHLQLKKGSSCFCTTVFPSCCTGSHRAFLSCPSARLSGPHAGWVKRKPFGSFLLLLKVYLWGKYNYDAAPWQAHTCFNCDFW